MRGRRTQSRGLAPSPPGTGRIRARTTLSSKQQKFVAQYLVDCDPAAAYRRAGYRGKNAAKGGAKLIGKPGIKRAIVERDYLVSCIRERAEAVVDPVVQGALTARAYGKSAGGELTLSALTDTLTGLTDAIADGDTARLEKMLAAQAHTLDVIYNRLALDSMNAQYVSHVETFLRLALRAQSQCRATCEAIAFIQNPPIAGYVQQANIAHGHQQVNNSAETPRGHAQNPPTKLLEQPRRGTSDWMDGRTSQEASGAHPHLEALAQVNRAEN